MTRPWMAGRPSQVMGLDNAGGADPTGVPPAVSEPHDAANEPSRRKGE